MTIKRSSFKLLIPAAGLCASLLVTACHSDFGPSPMPTGYAHEHSVYKSAPGPEPVIRKSRAEFERRWKNLEEGPKVSGGDRQAGLQPSLIVGEDKAGTAPDATPPHRAKKPAPKADPSHDRVSSAAWQSAADDLVMRLIRSFGQPREAVYMGSENAAASDTAAFAAALATSFKKHDVTITTHQSNSHFKIDHQQRIISPDQPSRRMLTLSLIAGQESIAEQSGIYTISGHAAPVQHDPMRHNNVTTETPSESAPAAPAGGQPLPLLSP